LKLLQQLVVGLPPSAVRLAVEHEKDAVDAVVTPTEPEAAEIRVRAEATGWTYLGLGRGTPLEFHPNGGSYLDAAAADEIRVICEAVVNGRFEELLWIRGDEVVKARSRIKLDQKVVRVSYGLLWSMNLFKPTQKVRRSYVAYA
jgi:hypothetical protein